jgi:hypothetical protein
MAHLFKLSELNPLKCHKDDCVPNVLSYLNLIERNESFKLANINDTMLDTHIIEFLDNTYGIKHDLLQIYNTDEDPSPDMVDDILEEQMVKEILDKQIKNNRVAIGIFLGLINHIALFGKKNNELFIIDPQSGEEISMEDPNVGLYLYKFHKINLVTIQSANKSPNKVRSNTNRFKRNSYMYTIKQRIRANPVSNTLRWSRHLLHHRDLIPFKKYKIIKKPNKEIMNSVFLRFEGNNALFQDITVPVAQHFFIELKTKSLKTKSLGSLTSISSKSLRSHKHSI